MPLPPKFLPNMRDNWELSSQLTREENPEITSTIHSKAQIENKCPCFLHIFYSDKPSGGILRSYEKYYLYLMGPVLFYYAAGHSLVGLDTKLPFLPLLLISAYTSIGITYSYLSLYHTVLSESMIIKIKQR